MFVAHIRMSYA